MDPPFLLTGLVGAFWSLPSVCFGVLLGCALAGTVFGASQAVWGALLGTLLGGLVAVGFILVEFQQDRLLGTLLLGSLLTPSALSGGLAAWLLRKRSRPFSGAAVGPEHP